MTVIHGIQATYKRERCRCGPCRYAASTARLLQEPLADPAPVKAHLLALSARGVGYRRAAELAGVSSGTAFRIVNEGIRPNARIARRLLAVPLDADPAERWPDALGSRRRLQALTAAGWPTNTLAVRLPGNESMLAQIIGRRESVLRRTAEAIAAVYAELQLVVPAESVAAMRARRRALRRGWFPPLAWDEETIDDPDALPCLLPPIEPVDRDLELLVQHVVAGHQVEASPAAIQEAIRRMPDAKNTEIAVIVRKSSQWVGDLRRRMKPC